MTSRASVVIMALLAWPTGAYAQQQAPPSLAEVARQAEAAKASVKKAKKSYTNSDLSADPRGRESAPPPANGFVSKSLGKAVPAEELVARSEEKVANDVVEKRQPEAWWRSRTASLRTQVDQLQERLAPLLIPNALRDESPVLKASVGVEIANVRAGLDALRKQWARFEASATEAKVPADWLEPRPQFPQ